MSTSTLAMAQQRWAINPGALQPLVQSYIDQLVVLGYRAATIDTLEERARHFCYWLNQSDVSVAHIDESVIDRFARHSCRCPGNRASDILGKAFISMVRQFVSFLERSHVVQFPAPTPDDGVHQGYLNWLRQHRGLSERTIDARRKLMNQLVPLLGPDPRVYDAAGIRTVIVAESQRRSAVNMKSNVTALRSYLFALSDHSRPVSAITGSGGAKCGPLEEFQPPQISTRRQGRDVDQFVRYDDGDWHSRPCHLAAPGASWSAGGRHHGAAHRRHQLAAWKPTRMWEGAQGSESPVAAGGRRRATEVSDRHAA